MSRLLFVTGTSPDVRGGSGTYVGVSVLREAVRVRGHEVEMLAPERGTVSLARRLFFNLSIRGAVRRLRPDVVVGFDLDGVFLALSEVPHIASIKGVVAEEARFEHGIPRLRLTAESLFERIHIHRADRVLAPSADCAARIAAHYAISAERIAIVPEPIDLARWRQALESTPQLPHEGSSILCVAHLYPRKDVATLLVAMTRLPDDIVLRVAGIGPELSRLKRKARGLRLHRRVEFLGHVPFERLTAEYRRADVFCLPSRQEGFGIVFLEAMAAGLPIVAARAAAVPEVVAEGECGILVPPGDADALAAALGGLLGDSSERLRFSEAGKQRVERYDAPKVAARFLEAIGLSLSS